MRGDRLRATLLSVTYPPGGASKPHSHSCPLVGHVVDGALHSRVAGGADTVYHAGESFREDANQAHVVSSNASELAPVTFLVWFVCDGDWPKMSAHRARRSAVTRTDGVTLFARLALGAAFLSGIASRFGWWGAGVGYGSWANFVKYTAQVNAFMPAATIPFLAVAATVAELLLGVALVGRVPAAVDGARERGAARAVRRGDGDLVRPEGAARLLGVLRMRRGAAAGETARRCPGRTVVVDGSPFRFSERRTSTASCRGGSVRYCWSSEARRAQLAGFSPVDTQVTRSRKLCTTAVRNAALEQWP